MKERIEKIIAKRIMEGRPVKLRPLRPRPDTKPIRFEVLREAPCSKCGNLMVMQTGQGRSTMICTDCMEKRRARAQKRKEELMRTAEQGEKILRLLNKPCTVDELASMSGLEPGIVRDRLHTLRSKGVIVSGHRGRLKTYRRAR